MSGKNVKRYDRGELRKPVKTPEGWLRVDGYLTRTGIFEYRSADGSKRRELRLPADVFDAKSLESFQLRPVTNDHPPGLLDASNAKTYQVGQLGESIRRDGDYVAASMLITDAKAIADVEAGKVELSGGYVCDLEFAPGEHNGERYDAIQRNIRGNHVAIVDVGRAGPDARLRLDAGDAVMVSPASSGGGAPPPKEKEQPLKTFKIDGVDYEVSEQAAQAIGKLFTTHGAALSERDEKIATLSKDLEKMKAKADTAEEQVKTLEKAKKDAEDPEKVAARVKARVELEGAARGILPEDQHAKLGGMADEEIRKAVIGAVFPEFKADGKSSDYIAARYDLAIESATKDRTDGVTRMRAATGGAPRADGGDQKLDAASSRAKMLEANRNAWQGEQKK